MATADEYAAAAWGYPLTRPDGTKQAAGSVLIDALFTAARAADTAQSTLEVCNEIADQIAALALVAGDPEAVKDAVREIVDSALNSTVLEVRPPA